jgi:hypothetical protein
MKSKLFIAAVLALFSTLSMVTAFAPSNIRAAIADMFAAENRVSTQTVHSSLAPPPKPLDWSYEVCEAGENSFEVTRLAISPDPPQRGQQLTVTVRGHLAKRVAEGSVLELEVRYMRIRLVKQRMDVCQELDKVENAPEYCPIEAGDKDWRYSVELPQQVPPGKYNIQLNLRDQDDQQVWCSTIDLEM